MKIHQTHHFFHNVSALAFTIFLLSGCLSDEEPDAGGTNDVGGTNTAPTISGTPASAVTAGSSFSFTPSASDADGDALTFAISGSPSWASFNTANGQLSGTPAPGDIGSYSNIVITVSDGQASANLAPFSIAVAAAPIEN